jgi:hypothetical protein
VSRRLGRRSFAPRAAATFDRLLLSRVLALEQRDHLPGISLS